MTKRVNSILLCLATAAMWLPSATILAQDKPAGPPNILIITADNLGYGDLKAYNPDSEIKTPRLDQLAAAGVKLTDFYTASPTCTVSRACLLTGRIPQRHGLVDQLAGVEGNYGVGLSHSEILIPRILKAAPVSYMSGCFGKWNIGFAEGSRPTERGFDEFLGHASGNLDYYNHNYREKHDLHQGIEPLDRKGEYSTEIFAGAAVDFITRQSQAGKPWFCYLPFNAPHFPSPGNKLKGEPNIWQAPDWAFETYGWKPDESDPRKRYAAVVTALDKAIGDVLDAVEKAGAEDNTFVFFMSDNGAFDLGRKGLDVGINGPLRSGGVTCWEGGLRVAALARWPGRIKAGSVCSEPLWSPDLLIACARLANVALPAGVVYDGRDPLPTLTGDAGSPHHSLYFNYRNHAALRAGEWKIVREKPDQPWQLFNLGRDVSESQNLAGSQPEKAQQLAAQFADWEQSYSDETRLPRHVAVKPADGPIKLFNGKDLDGFYTWIRDSGYEDPKQIFTVQDGMIRISGDGYGGLITEKEYRDYHLVIEFKWGEKTWGNRVDRARDSGLLLHCWGPDGGYSNTWMASIEAQIIEGGVGDILVLTGKNADSGRTLPTYVTANITNDRDGEKVWQKDGRAITITAGRINWYGRDVDWADKVGFRGRDDVESPFGEWTRMDVIAEGGHLLYKVNGKVVNEAFNATPDFGKILLQTEQAEMYVRRYELWPIGKAPQD